MKYLGLSKAFIAFVTVLFMALGSTAHAQSESNEGVQPSTPEVSSEAKKAVETELTAGAVEEVADRRSEILREAVDALAETKSALAALDENKIDDALDALAMVTGKLQILVARDPSLGLAPTDVSYSLHDIYSDKKSIEVAIDEAKEALDEGRIQVARTLLDVLASEMVVNVSHLPLATYPDAITAIVPLIDAGKLQEAKKALQSALNTQVVKEYVIPMPVIRAGLYLDLAEDLAEREERSEEDNTNLNDYLAAAKKHLEMSEVLGYGNQETYSNLYAQLEDIESRVSDGKSGHGLFDLLRKSMDTTNEDA